MHAFLDRFALVGTQILFSRITPFLLIQRIAGHQTMRRMVADCFGRSYRGRYDKISDNFLGHYGSPLVAGLATVIKIARREITLIADCGTGTGYAIRVAAGCFPKAIFLVWIYWRI